MCGRPHRDALAHERARGDVAPVFRANTPHRHREGVPLIGQFLGQLGKFKREIRVAFLGTDIVGVGPQFFSLVPQPIPF